MGCKSLLPIEAGIYPAPNCGFFNKPLKGINPFDKFTLTQKIIIRIFQMVSRTESGSGHHLT